MTDIWRDTNLRYLGYANEVGEAFRPLVPNKWVRWSYGVATAYVIADTADKSFKMLRKDGRPMKVLVATGDALLWQTLASIVIPGYTINRICYYTQYGLKKYVKTMNHKMVLLTSVFVGIASIPIIVKPIDTGTSVFMDLTYRKIFGS